MTISASTTATDRRTSTVWSTGTITAPSDGDLVVLAICANGTDNTITVEDGFTELTQANIGGGESARYSIQWKIAGASEPTEYTAAINSNANNTTIMKTFSTTESFFNGVDAGPSTNAEETTASNTHPCNSITVSDNSVAIAFWFEDGSDSQLESADSPYTGVVQITDRNNGAYHAIRTTGVTTGTVNLTSSSASTRLFHTVHASWKEAAATPIHFRRHIGFSYG